MKQKLNIIQCACCKRDMKSPLKEGEIDYCNDCLADENCLTEAEYYEEVLNFDNSYT